MVDGFLVKRWSISDAGDYGRREKGFPEIRIGKLLGGFSVLDVFFADSNSLALFKAYIWEKERYQIPA
jgi:hypothetical protein